MGRDQDTSAANTSCYVQILGVGTDTGCTVPSALLFFDRQRYLFNAGEGFQRFCVEHRVRMTRINAVLATRVTTEATGGLPGMLLTMADTTAGGLLTGHTGIAVHGPPGLHTLVNAFRTFVNIRDLGLKVMEFGSGAPNNELTWPPRPVIKNDAVSISPIVLRPSNITENTEEKDASDQPSAKRQKTESAGDGMDVPSTPVESAAACYVCQLPDIPGKFLPHKAASLGVPRGPLYGQLVKGLEVVAANGRVVTPDDVMEPRVPGPVVLVIDCPSEAFLPSLVDTAKGIGWWAVDDGVRSKVACVVHLTPRLVTRVPDYVGFIQSFGDHVHHIMVAESQESKIPIMKKSTELQVKLAALDPDLFALPQEAPAIEGTAAPALPANCVVGENLLRFRLRPVAKRGIDREECGEPLDADAVVTALRAERPLAIELAEKARKAQNLTDKTHKAVVQSQNSNNDDPIITFLGTGAAIPSKYRNVTGVLIDMPTRGAAMLADCGEGSLGQMRRRLGEGGANDVLRRLTAVWISHIHADHHVGLPALLAARTRLMGLDCPPVLVIGPRPLRRALTAYAGLEPMRFRFVEATMTTPDGAAAEAEPPAVAIEVIDALQTAKIALGLSKLESIRVIHCAHSYGLVLESPESGANSVGPWKIVISGDTRPCDALVEASRGATLLIHEATFDDSMGEEAVEKKHCTTKEAVEAGAAAGAYRTLLTHFSQRYPKVPVIDDNFVDHVGIAFDLMSVRLQDLPRLPALVPAFKVLFDEAEAEEGGDAAEPVPTMLS